MPQLDPTWFVSQLFWLAISFAVLYVLISRMALPPLLEIAVRRKDTIEGDINTAQGLKSEAEQARIDYERLTAEARNQAQQQLTDALAASKAQAEKAGRDMDQQIAAQLSEATRRIEAKKQELMSGLTPTSAELAGMIVEKLTQRAPSSDQLSRVIHDLSKGRS